MFVKLFVYNGVNIKNNTILHYKIKDTNTYINENRIAELVVSRVNDKNDKYYHEAHLLDSDSQFFILEEDYNKLINN